MEDSTVDVRDTRSDGDIDLISGLNDDVLLRILELVAEADATGAVHTGALSRRWRVLWTRIPALRFGYRPVMPQAANVDERCAALERYNSFVNDVLVRRAQSDCAIENLAISCTKNSTSHLPSSSHAAQGWIRYAFQHGVRSFILDLPPNLSAPMVVLDELPSPMSLETMHLSLGYISCTRLRLPTTIKFASLTDLSLEGIDFVSAGSVCSLSRFVSSASCPRLQKLRMVHLSFDAFDGAMRIEADVLSNLSVSYVDVMALELKTPRLRILHLHKCNHEVLRVSAPRLEELMAIYQPGCSPRLLEVEGDFPCVWSLKICLWSYDLPDHLSYSGKPVNDISKLLLKLCNSVTCLDVKLYGQKEYNSAEILKSRVPYLPHVTSLTVNVSIPMEHHDFEGSVAILLTRFMNLRRLSIHLSFFLCMSYGEGRQLCLGCYHPDHWVSNEISLAHLQEVELTGLIGTDCELPFMKNVFSRARGIRKVAINFNPAEYLKYLVKMQMDAFERMLLNEGMWISHRDTLQLTCLKVVNTPSAPNYKIKEEEPLLFGMEGIHAWTCKV